LGWFYGVDAQIQGFLVANRLSSTAALVVVLIWIHLVWDVDRTKLKLAYDLRAHGVSAILRAKPSDPEL